jgi:hypothetical protein
VWMGPMHRFLPPVGCRKRLLKMIASIGERLAAKLGNANDNAFKMRRLCKMYDKEGTGEIHLEDLRMMYGSHCPLLAWPYFMLE